MQTRTASEAKNPEEGFSPRVWPLMQLRVCIRKILWGTFNQLPREQIENSRDFPREQIHHTTPSSFQQILPNFETNRSLNRVSSKQKSTNICCQLFKPRNSRQTWTRTSASQNQWYCRVTGASRPGSKYGGKYG